jgi:hypothetical protein
MSVGHLAVALDYLNEIIVVVFLGLKEVIRDLEPMRAGDLTASVPDL